LIVNSSWQQSYLDAKIPNIETFKITLKKKTLSMSEQTLR